MTSPKVYNTFDGFIILDAVLALALGAFFISIIFYNSNAASDAVRKAKISSENIVEPQFNLGIGNTIVARPDSLCSTDFSRSSSNGLSSTGLGQPSSVAPPKIKKINLPIPANIPLTHAEVRNGFAYVSTDSTQVADPDLYVIDIHNPDTSSIVDSINTGPGIASFVVIGKYIFAATASTVAQLHILSLDNSRHLSLIEKYQLPLPYATATPPYATAISYIGGHVFIGTEKWDGNEFASIDISAPTSPQFSSGFEIGNKVNDIFAQDDFAYVSSAGEGQLRIFNVKDSAQPTLAGTFSSSGWNRQEGKIVSLFNGDLIFGRTSGGYDINTDKELFYWPAISTSTPVSGVSDLSNFEYSQNIPGGVYGIIQDQRNIYVATRQTGKELMVFNNTTNFQSPMGLELSTTSASLQLEQPQSMTCDSSHVYVLSHISPTLYEISFY